MKKIIFVVAVLLSTGTLSAQEFVEFGAKGGVNFASLSGDDTEGLDGVTSFHLGLVAEIPLTESFSIQPEVLYSGMGASNSEGDGMIKLDYITVPVMLKYYVVDGVSLEAGPQVAFNVVAESDFEGETEELEDIKSTDIGAGVGLGYEFPIKLFLQARYVFGFSDIMDDVAAKNNAFQISGGYKF